MGGVSQRCTENRRNATQYHIAFLSLMMRQTLKKEMFSNHHTVLQQQMRIGNRIKMFM